MMGLQLGGGIRVMAHKFIKSVCDVFRPSVVQITTIINKLFSSFK